ncbi:hypothetical protein [Algoriphagus algorifonticola]|uniref:hypothetical protein n=1 Tax=Algoriphagus algorifonticola TaxID=2593007 RepID=UPI0011A86B7D|nr:hypothetical protein [Algoriphagus algorifonticola]
MKLISILLGVLFSTTATFAQDKIVKHTGDIISCKVTEILENSIKYKYEGEELITSISFSQVDKILFSSGRIQKISEKIVIIGEEDWEKVSITNIPEEVLGLVKKGEVSGKATGAWGAASNAEKVYAKALEKLKREAAKKGAHLIFTKDLIVKDGDIMTGQWAKSMVNGVAYGYQ